MMVYGDLSVTDVASVSLPLGKLVLSRVDDGLVRIEFTGDVSVRSKLVGIGRRVQVSLRPIPPSGNLIKVSHLFIRLKEPITVLPRESLEVMVSLPVDLGVYVGEYLIYSVPTARVKYALYGPPDLGDLCRYVSSELLSSLPAYLVGSTRLAITNSSNGDVSVSRVVCPLGGLQVYVAEPNEPVYSYVVVRVVDQSHAEVSTRLTPSKEVRSVKYVFRGTESTYVMRYGV